MFSLGAVVWQEPQGVLGEHFCGISVENDPMGLGRDASGHIAEALGLAITLGTLAVRIERKGGMIGAFVMDSLNFIANLTSTPPSWQMDVVLRLLTHEFGAYMEIWIVLREAYGKFGNVKNWPPHVTAKDKRITHQFTRSGLECPPTEESKRALSFLNLYQGLNNGGIIRDQWGGLIATTTAA